MPIRPDLRKFYGRAWKSIRLVILQRANNRCERCGVPNKKSIVRVGGFWLESPGVWRDNHGVQFTDYIDPFPKNTRRTVRIVLSVAHLNHTPGDDRPDNLRAYCAWCHLHYDQQHHAETRKTRKDAKRPLLSLLAIQEARV